MTIIGNDAAKLILDLSEDWNLFIVGDCGSQEAREEMASWLEIKFPGVPILTLNPSTTLMPHPVGIPKILVCLNCSAAQFVVPEAELSMSVFWLK